MCRNSQCKRRNHLILKTKMRLHPLSWLVVLISCGIFLCDDYYFYEIGYQCDILLLPFNDGNVSEFKWQWDAYLDFLGEDVFESFDRNEVLTSAESRCGMLKIDNDSLCTFRDLVSIGNLIEHDILKLKEMFDPELDTSMQAYSLYFCAWLMHPITEKCKFPDSILSRCFDLQLSELNSFNASLNRISVYDNILSKKLRQEIDIICPMSFTEKFCMTKIMTNTVDKVDKVLTYVGREQSDNKTSKILETAMRLYLSAVPKRLLKLVPYKSREDFVILDESQVYDSIQQITIYIFDSFQKHQIESIVQVVEKLSDGFYVLCDHSTVFTSVNKIICFFSSMIDALSMYHYVKISKVNIKQIRTNIDYETFLREKRFEMVLKIGEATQLTVEQVAHHLKVEMKNNLEELKNYFKRIAHFDLQKTQADIEYIDSTLKKYKFASDASCKKMNKLMDEIIKGVLVATIGDSGEALLKFSFKVAEAINPLRAMFGGGVASDLLDAAQELARALSGIAKAATLSISFDRLIQQMKIFLYKLNKNDIFLASVASLINNLRTVTSSSPSSSSISSEFEEQKNKFLYNYNIYTPAVRKDELREIAAYWETVVEEACNILESTYGVVASVTKTVLASKGSCFSAKVEVQKLITTYEEIYDFQFALMDSLANCMRAWTSYKAANILNSDFDAATLKNDDKPGTFSEQQSAAFSMISYKMSMMAATDSYCDILEYLEGHRPQVCVGPEPDITSLLSRTHLKCTILEDFKVIPTKPSKLGDKAYISLEDLYAGKPVTFKIPDSQWLIDHKWILPMQRHDTIFVKKMEIFLPIVSEWNRQVRVKAHATVGNQLTTPNGTEYVISPAPILEYMYKEGKRGRECRLEEFSNPYNDHCRDMPKICPVTKEINNCDSRGNIFPSIYVQWNITVNGYEMANPAVPSTDIPLVAGLQLCILPVSTSVWRKRKDFNYKTSKRQYPVEQRQSWEVEKCCKSNYYYNETEQRCTACPPGTVDKYNGLFCGKIIRFVPAPTKETTFSFDNAQNTCENTSSKTASEEDIKKAVALGDDSCGCGWVSNGTVVAPKPNESCEENDGNSTMTCDSNNTWGVYCLNNF